MGNSKGYSLVELIVILGLSSILSLGMATQFGFQNRAAANLVFHVDLNEAVVQARQILSDPNSCKRNFQTVRLTIEDDKLTGRMARISLYDEDQVVSTPIDKDQPGWGTRKLNVKDLRLSGKATATVPGQNLDLFQGELFIVAEKTNSPSKSLSERGLSVSLRIAATSTPGTYEIVDCTPTGSSSVSPPGQISSVEEYELDCVAGQFAWGPHGERTIRLTDVGLSALVESDWQQVFTEIQERDTFGENWGLSCKRNSEGWIKTGCNLGTRRTQASDTDLRHVPNGCKSDNEEKLAGGIMTVTCCRVQRKATTLVADHKPGS